MLNQELREAITSRLSDSYSGTEDCAGGSYTHHRDYAQGEDGNALTAAELLVDKMGWDGIEITGMGTLPNGDYVCTTEFVEVAA